MFTRIKKAVIQLLQNNVDALNRNIRQTRDLAIKDYIEKQMLEPRYRNPKRLNRYEYQVYSQNGEDGIINEIFRRIGTTDKFFVEIAVGDGTENNSAFLLLKSWMGCWIEGDKKNVNNIIKKFKFLIDRKDLSVKHAFVKAENIEDLLEELNVSQEIDLLSVDIDGNDYWVWKAIHNYQPRVVVIEYNALFPPDVEYIIEYNPNFIWDGSCYFGASLKSLAILGAKKKYKLVGCNFLGVNAFFVREDLTGDEFLEPFTAKNHYEHSNPI